MKTPLPAGLQARINSSDIRGALELCQARLSEQPDDADTCRHLAQLQAAADQIPQALRYARRACELAPADARTWSDLGRVQIRADELQSAIASFRHALQIDPRYADGWHNLGTALKRSGEKQAAFTALKNALVLDTTRADTYLNLGNLLIENRQFEDAVECLERAAKHDSGLAPARSQLAQHLSRNGKVKRAESLFRQSVSLDPDNVQGWFGLGRTLEDLGEADGALGCYQNVLSRRPDHAQALCQYLGLIRDNPETELVNSAQAMLNNSDAADEARALIGYGLARYYDRRAEYQQAITAALAANAARRRAAGSLDRDALKARVDGLIKTYNADFFFQRWRFGLGTDQPVFIIGLPRSGTTLTEQILSAHPLLHGAGELPDLAQLAIDSLDQGQMPWQAGEKLDETRSRDYARRYLHALRDGVPKRRLRISDKSPLNFFQLAFAALLFPNARVIHCRRNARDNALSIWLENFNPNQHYATDFDDLAFLTTQYRRLMAHWQAVLPLPILELQYEETITDLEKQARRIMEFLGAPWNSRCLEFHKSERAVQTPSRWQVRQPLYASSVGRWRNYQMYLPDLLRAFPGEA